MYAAAPPWNPWHRDWHWKCRHRRIARWTCFRILPFKS